jgi:superfamily II DNA or RNA helicase
MTRQDAAKLLREELDKNGLSDWGVRYTNDPAGGFLGLCSYKDKCIILNAYHVSLHPDPEIENTIKHEIAHALTEGHKHDEVWEAKARELGCTNTNKCSHLYFSPEIIDAIRSGAEVEVTFETEVIHKPKYTVTRLQDKCPTCNKVAVEKFSITTKDKDGNEIKLITLECYHIIKKVIPRGTPFEEFITHEHKNNNCKHDWDKNKCITCGAFRLFEFQVNGARFLEKSLATHKGAALFDEMGLGKTVQPLAFLSFHKEALPALFVVKSGIKFQFFKEIIRWLGPDYLAQVISTSKDYVFPGLKCYIISYDLLRRFPIEKIQALGIKTIILDECQQIKNPDSARTQEVRKIVKGVDNVIPLSGTPWKNRGSEFFTVLNMLDPMKFPSYNRYLNQWVDYYYHGNKLKEGGIRNPQKFKEYIGEIALRRERAEVMSELPLVNRTILYCELGQLEQKSYDEEVSDFVKWYNSAIIGGEEDSFETQTNLLAKLARMRHITGLAKIPATVEFTQEFVEETDRKLVIFVHHKDVGELLFRQIEEKSKEWNNGLRVMKLTAEKSSEERFEMQEEFNKLPRAILVASTLASGEGLNLQTCADCVMHERQWNPANEEQAEGRFIRIGQTAESVNATYTTAAGTVDEHLSGIVENKRVAFHAAMNKGEIPKWNQTELVKELAESIVRDHNKKNK